jgi:hypothetical protein
LILDFEFDQHLESHKHVINIIMWFRDMGVLHYGQAQHGYSSLLKGELLDQVLTLPFGILPSSDNASDLVGQLLEVCLGRIPCMVHILYLSSKLAGLPSNKGQ